MAEGQQGEKSSLRERWSDIGADQYREEMDRRHRQVKSRSKVSSSDMEELWERRREQFAQRMSRRSINVGLTLRLGVGGLGLLGAALLGANMNATLAAAETAAVEHETAVQAWEREISALDLQQDDSAVALEDTLETYLADARSAGTKVADLQNEFAEILVAANTQERLDDIGPFPAEMDAAAHRKELASLWAKGSLLVESEQTAYGVSQMDPFSSYEMDPRYAWYLMMEEPRGFEYASPDAYSWELTAAMPRFESSPELIEVTWLNRRDDGWLLSWATATYNAEEEVFSNLRLGRTTTGVEYQHWGADHGYAESESFSDEDLLEEDEPETPDDTGVAGSEGEAAQS